MLLTEIYREYCKEASAAHQKKNKLKEVKYRISGATCTRKKNERCVKDK